MRSKKILSSFPSHAKYVNIVLKRPCSSARGWTRPHQVKLAQKWPSIVSRGFRSTRINYSTIYRRLNSVKTGEEAAFAEEGEGFSRRQVTLEVDNPEKTSPTEVLSLLEEYLQSQPKWGDMPDNQEHTMTILTTPSFASWLEDGHPFLPSLVKQMATYHELTKRLSREVHVVAAVVDGIAPPVCEASLRTASIKEGISILHSPYHNYQRMWDKADAKIPGFSTQRSALIFPGVLKTASITLPLANTLFINGRHSTLLVSNWKAKDGIWIKRRGQEKSNQIINIAHDSGLAIKTCHIPAFPLTPARPIVSGLGNIVRQVEFSKDGAGPASRELEATIDDYLSSKQEEKSKVAVWALIVPADIAFASSPESPTGLVMSKSDVKTAWFTKSLRGDYIGYWLERGATFCRVLSGGGGWGVKQGLLSLDPETSYGVDDEPLSSNPLIFPQNEQTSALGNLAQPGSYIQFFTAPSQHNIDYSRVPEEISTTNESWRTLVLGTVPSTIDEVKSDSEERPSTNGRINVHHGHFGAVSETGLFIHPETARKSKGLEPIRESKIDLPYSCFYQQLAPISYIDPTPSFIHRPDIRVKGRLRFKYVGF